MATSVLNSQGLQLDAAAQRRLLFRGTGILVAAAILVWIAFQPRVANHFGYALPVHNGLPCRISFSGRDYANNSFCEGMNQSAYSSSVGSTCTLPAALRRQKNWPLRQVASVWTLFGAAYPIMLPAGIKLRYVPTYVFVKDGACYRTFALEGGP